MGIFLPLAECFRGTYFVSCDYFCSPFRSAANTRQDVSRRCAYCLTADTESIAPADAAVCSETICLDCDSGEQIEVMEELGCEMGSCHRCGVLLQR